VPPLEAWERVLVDLQILQDSEHGAIACVDCHAGVESPQKETAHAGLIADPSEDFQSTCGTCHPAQSQAQLTNLHYTLEGYDTSLHARSYEDAWPALEEMEANHCDSCHTTCGQCHVSQPANVGGGLLAGHAYVRTPPMTRTCTACHGSRVGNEFLGKNEGVLADVHFRQARMVCVDCHVSDDMHGETSVGDEHRYDGIARPSCTDCHPDVVSGESEIMQHNLHTDILACQVCHSVEYKSCDGCHVQQTEDGVPYFETDNSYMTFYIGLNPLQSEERPYQYVLLRHVPVAPDSFDYYGDNLLALFNSLPTWRYATPHNIQRETPQNSACENCHGSDQYFLTAEVVAPLELEANQPVIVENGPSALGQ
jgi:hypothetical protein